MGADQPGWYFDPKRPGIRRYWDGHGWVDVDQIVDEHGEPPSQREPSSPTTASSPGPRLIAQRRPDGEATDLESPPPAGEQESLPD